MTDAADSFTSGTMTWPVEATRDELTQLNRRLLDQQKRTNRHLAQSLNDELGQTLAALRLHWDAWRGAPAEQRECMDERIANLIGLANRQVRGVLAELRPPLLEELGLAAAIDNEIRQHPGIDGEPRIELLASETTQHQRWPADIEYAVFMIAHEALLNALRHASARAITVRLDGDDIQLELAVSDDGCGLQAAAGPGHLGLIGMRERALAIGAALRIDGRPGHGTMVALTWEASDEAHADEPHLPDR
jgi:signal transduction histidine kinase